jgi:dihydroorotate dehydrogenase (NAD+) catalytic subunit
MGGISCFEDVLEFIYAGATAVAIGTAQFPNPLLPIEILDDLERNCEESGVKLEEIRGTVRF